jgi:hypothetical protein
LEQTPKPAMAHHVHRTAAMGQQVLINASWYYPIRTAQSV